MKKGLFIFLFAVVMTGIVFNHACKKSNSDSNSMLVGIKWLLESIRYSDQNILQIERTFSILFNEDKSLEMEVDCNSCAGTYELGANRSISFIDHRSCTEVDCGPDSKDTEFHAALDTASRYDINGSRLIIYFNTGQSTLNFNAQ
jgi:heat shock protein HslJ